MTIKGSSIPGEDEGGMRGVDVTFFSQSSNLVTEEKLEVELVIRSISGMGDTVLFECSSNNFT